jgi:hypothetical protein
MSIYHFQLWPAPASPVSPQRTHRPHSPRPCENGRRRGASELPDRGLSSPSPSYGAGIVALPPLSAAEDRNRAAFQRRQKHPSVAPRPNRGIFPLLSNRTPLAEGTEDPRSLPWTTLNPICHPLAGCISRHPRLRCARCGKEPPHPPDAKAPPPARRPPQGMRPETFFALAMLERFPLPFLARRKGAWPKAFPGLRRPVPWPRGTGAGGTGAGGR